MSEANPKPVAAPEFQGRYHELNRQYFSNMLPDTTKVIWGDQSLGLEGARFDLRSKTIQISPLLAQLHGATEQYMIREMIHVQQASLAAAEGDPAILDPDAMPYSENKSEALVGSGEHFYGLLAGLCERHPGLEVRLPSPGARKASAGVYRPAQVA